MHAIIGPSAVGKRSSVASAMKKPAAAVKVERGAAKKVVAPKAKSKSVKAEERYRMLLAMPVKVARPCQSDKPTAHAGGKIYYSKAENTYRVKVRSKDRVDVKVRANFDDKKLMRERFQVCCAMIEHDKRPVHA